MFARVGRACVATAANNKVFTGPGAAMCARVPVRHMTWPWFLVSCGAAIGLIHPCTHPEDREPPESEEQMMVDIFKYIDRIFSIVRPRRLIYLAVDGPAPRAKMNQQRARRFRAAQAAAASAAEIASRRAELEQLRKSLPRRPPTANFDSNCITPGTAFMERVAAHLEWYVRHRLETEPAWAGLTVLLSDASVPGEGEHKIMDFLRTQRSAPGHDPNLRHVIYGADADLIMLGLASHEPYFTVPSARSTSPLPIHPTPAVSPHKHTLNSAPGVTTSGRCAWYSHFRTFAHIGRLASAL